VTATELSTNSAPANAVPSPTPPSEHGSAHRAIPAEVPRTGAGAALGMPAVMAGALAFALAVAGYAPVGAIVPVLLIAGVGQIIASRTTARSGEGTLSLIHAAFAGFWLTYAVLVLGLNHNWFGISIDDTVRAITVFLASWLAVALIATIASAALPLAYTGALLLFDAAVGLLISGSVVGTPILFTAAGGALFALAGLAAYLAVATGTSLGLQLMPPLGRPLMHPRPPRPGVVFTNTPPDPESPPDQD
jgi:hypothetical protein